MNRDVNGLQLAQRMGRAQRLLVDTYSGVILGYADTNGKTGEVRPKVYEAIAGSRVSIMTVKDYILASVPEEYQHIVTEEERQKKIMEGHPTASEWYDTLQHEGTFPSILGIANIKSEEL